MSEYTAQQILQMIEEAGGPENLDLSGKDLSGIDLSPEVIRTELEKRRQKDPEAKPLWVQEEDGRVRGINLKRANLQGAELQRANLQGAWLDGANLQEAELYGANLQGAELWKANLQGAWLNGANLQGARLEGADLQRASLEVANLLGATLDVANLQGATLWAANLQGATLKWANLQGATLGRANLKEVDLFGIENAAGAYWYGAKLDRARMKASALQPAIGEEIDKNYGMAHEVYLAFKVNFEQLGRYADAAWAYQKERNMGRHTHWPRSARRHYGTTELADLAEKGWRGRWGLACFYAWHAWAYIWDWTVELLCGYGEIPRRVLGWGLFALLVFPLLYWFSAGVGMDGVASLKVEDYIIFSLGAFTTIDLAGLEAVGMAGRLLTSLEALTGLFITGLALFVLGNKIRRS